MELEISDLNFSYNKKTIFENLNLKIKEGDFLFITGSTSCGKTTLIKILAGLIKTNIKTLEKKEIGIVFDNPENFFVAETVKEEISFTLINLKYKKTEIEKKVKEITSLLKIEYLLDYNPHSLSGGEKELVSLAAALINNPKLLLIDGTFAMLDELTKEKIMKLLKKLNKEQKLTIICTTANLEDVLYGKELVLIDKKVVLKEKIKNAFNDEKIFKKYNLELPFLASLSHKLKYYGLIDKIILNMDKMVNELWK